jgi:hypothetical protein
MWHAQNALSSMYSPADAAVLKDELHATIAHIRAAFPQAVFVTGAELAQLKASGRVVRSSLDCSR